MQLPSASDKGRYEELEGPSHLRRGEGIVRKPGLSTGIRTPLQRRQLSLHHRRRPLTPVDASLSLLSLLVFLRFSAKNVCQAHGPSNPLPTNNIRVRISYAPAAVLDRHNSSPLLA